MYLFIVDVIFVDRKGSIFDEYFIIYIFYFIFLYFEFNFVNVYENIVIIICMCIFFYSNCLEVKFVKKLLILWKEFYFVYCLKRSGIVLLLRKIVMK